MFIWFIFCLKLPRFHSFLFQDLLLFKSRFTLKHGRSDGRVGDLRSKVPGFNPCLDPMRLCFKIYDIFASFCQINAQGELTGVFI